MYSVSVCRVSVLIRWSWNVLCRGNHLSAGFADMLRQILLQNDKSIKINFFIFNKINNIISFQRTISNSEKKKKNTIQIKTQPEKGKSI